MHVRHQEEREAAAYGRQSNGHANPCWCTRPWQMVPHCALVSSWQAHRALVQAQTAPTETDPTAQTSPEGHGLGPRPHC
eukprot:7847534-Alexandrium_andersonii.AAC.1